MSYIEYSSNNSGGSWWLSDDDWYALEKAGWKIKWGGLEQKYEKNEEVIDDDGMPLLVKRKGNNYGMLKKDKDGKLRFLGALATRAYRQGLSMEESIVEFESITGQDTSEEGCPCCGNPHNFYLRGV